MNHFEVKEESKGQDLGLCIATALMLFVISAAMFVSIDLRPIRASASNAPQTVLGIPGCAGPISIFHTPNTHAYISGIALGSDSNMWVTEGCSSNVDKVMSDGTITEYPRPIGASSADGITLGNDSRIWFAEHYGNKIGAITTTGVVSEYHVPNTTAATTIED